MMEMIRQEYIGNLHQVSTNIVRMHMGPEFRYQQHNLVIISTAIMSNAHHFNNHMMDMEQKYMRGDATRMET
jgi:hypothetical protein